MLYFTLSHFKKSCLEANVRMDKGQVKVNKSNAGNGLIQVKYSCSDMSVEATSAFYHSAEASFLSSHMIVR